MTAIPGNTLATGLQGVQSGLERANRAAEDIVATASGTEAPSQEAPSSLAESVVELNVAENQVQASAAVVETADETLGTLLDTRA